MGLAVSKKQSTSDVNASPETGLPTNTPTDDTVIACVKNTPKSVTDGGNHGVINPSIAASYTTAIFPYPVSFGCTESSRSAG